MNSPATTRAVPATRPPGSPPAIWAAFAAQAAWKNWVIAAQLALIALLVTATMRIARREPDVVLVEPDGKSTYVNRSVAGEALLRFIAEQHGRPSDVTVAHFSRDFLRLFLAVNSSTIEAAWPAALAQMTPGLSARIERDADAQKLLQTYRLAQVRTDLAIDDLLLVERAPDLLHVRATVTRRKAQLVGENGPVSTDQLTVDLVEKIVARTSEHPDGLEIADIRVHANATEEKPHAP